MRRFLRVIGLGIVVVSLGIGGAACRGEEEAGQVVPTEDLGSVLVRATRTDGVLVALTTLADWVRTDPSVGAVCHTLAHTVGQEAARLLPLNDAVQYEPGICLNGYLHGVLQAYATSGEDFSVHTAAAACRTVDVLYADTCMHGLGHLLTVRYPDAIRTALTTCLMLNEVDAGRCAGGVVMEFGQNYLAERHGAVFPGIAQTMGPDGPVRVSLTTEELANPCAALADAVWAYECWTAVAPFWIGTLADLSLRGSNAALLLSRCGGVAEMLQHACAYSIGGWMIDPVADALDEERAIDAAEEICAMGLDGTVRGCMTGVFVRLTLGRDVEMVRQWCDRWAGEMAAGCTDGVRQAAVDQERIRGGI